MCKNVENLSYRIFENMHTHLYEFCIFFFQIITIHLKQRRGRGRKIQKMKNVKMFCHNVTMETQEFSKCL